jgi:phosphoribosylformylglycinamidine synthase
VLPHGSGRGRSNGGDAQWAATADLIDATAPRTQRDNLVPGSRLLPAVPHETVPMKALIRITLKPGVLDPQGKAIEGAIGALGILGVGEVRQGKYIEVDLGAADEAAARSTVERMCKDLLANTVIENYAFEIVR